MPAKPPGTLEAKKGQRTAYQSNQEVDAIEKESVIEFVNRLNKDHLAAAKTLGRDELKWLLKTYMKIQADRTAAQRSIKFFDRDGKPHILLDFVHTQHLTMEKSTLNLIKRYVYSCNHPAMDWMRQVYGVGPVIAGYMFANIDITRSPTPGHILSFAGLNPNMVWNKGEKRPYNSTFKKVCFYLGQAIIKSKNRVEGGTFYGNLYDMRYAYEMRKNLRGDYADQAAKYLATKYKGTKAGPAITALKAGQLPNHGIMMRAMRWTVKMFISHLYEVWRQAEGLPFVNPYPIGIMGHAAEHYISPEGAKQKEITFGYAPSEDDSLDSEVDTTE